MMYLRRYSIVRIVIVLSVFWIGWGCDGDPEKRETIRELRVLGIRAEPPSARPKERIKLSALAVNYPSKTIQYAWYLCKSSTQSTGCHADPKAISLGKQQTAEATIPEDYLKTQTSEEKHRGRYLFVTLVVQSGEEKVISVKRIVVSEQNKNQNPAIQKISIRKAGSSTDQEEPYAIDVKQNYSLSAAFSDASRERYTGLDSTGKKQEYKEKLYISWYTTEGTFSQGYLTQDGDGPNIWTLPKEAPKTSSAQLYVIVRDGRGGMDWKKIQTTLKKTD